MKIVPAVNAMLSNPSKISEVRQNRSGELFFLYDQKFKWSIQKRTDGTLALFYYPGDQTIAELASWDDHDFDDFNEMVYYNSREIGTPEAIASFSELHRVVKEQEYDMNTVLDQIIATDDIPW